MANIENLNVKTSVDVKCLSRIFDNTVATYKFYWFNSIINLILRDPDKLLYSFYEIIAGMISEAWYWRIHVEELAA